MQTSPEAVTFHLARPDADLPFKLALPAAFPVPATIPTKDQGVAAVPGTGPYMISDARSRTVSLVRNPAFAEWSSAAQPDGFVDSIDWRFARPAEAAFDQLDRGVDVFTDPPPSAPLAALLATHPDQVTLSPTFTTFFVGLDVAKPPFDDVRVRRALSYAIDRERIVELLGGQTAQDVSCQVLPPTYQGHVPYCPYTTDAADGEWSGPDMERATALVKEARVGRTRVTVLTSDAGLPSGAVAVMRLVAETLDEIGVPARLKVLQDEADYFTTLTSAAGTDEHPHVYFAGWAQDYPAASNFMVPLFACPSEDSFNTFNTSGWCSRSLDQKMDAALRLYTTDPGASSRAWARVEHQVIREALVTPLANPLSRYAVAERVANVQVNPQWGLLLSRLWVE